MKKIALKNAKVECSREIYVLIHGLVGNKFPEYLQFYVF